MSTLELKNSKDGEKKDSKGKPLKPNKSKEKKTHETKLMVDPIPTSSSVNSSSSRLSTHPTSGLASDLESLHHKMNAMLSRASQVTQQEEDESDLKMRQLLEEIYSVPSSYDEVYLHPSQFGGRGEDERDEVDDERWRRFLHGEVEEEIEDMKMGGDEKEAEEVEELLEGKYSYEGMRGETKGIF